MSTYEDPEVIFDTDIDVEGEIAEADEFVLHQMHEAQDTWAEEYAAHLWRTR